MKADADRARLGKETASASNHRVPGADAPICNIERIWNSMGRWIMGSRTVFASFLHSMNCNLPSVEEGTAFTTWPMSPPYPHWFGAENAETCKMSSRQRSKEKVMNLMVTCLSWMHLQQPSKAPAALRVGCPLSKKQWRVVRYFEELITPLLLVGDIGPASMGRTRLGFFIA